MAGVRRTKDRNGKFHKNWRFHFVDYRGKRKWGTGTSSKSDTLRAAQALEEEHRLIRLGYRPLPKSSEKARAFDDVVSEYIAWGEVQGGRGGRPWGATHAASRRRHLPWWQRELSLTLVSDLMGCLPRAEKALRTLQASSRSGKTLANYAESICAFCDWCVGRGYLETDPLKDLRSFDTTPQSRRRAMTREELVRLLDAAPSERRLLYAVACATGLRKKELASLQVRHLDLDQRGLVLEAAWTKNRKEGFQPLPYGLLGPRCEATVGKASDEALLDVPSHTARSLDRELKAAGITKVTEKGKIDFHALRVTYTTLVIEAGATVKEAQTLLRHSTPQLTMNTYARTRPDRMREVADEVGNAVQIDCNRATSVQRAVVGARADRVNPSEAMDLQSSKGPGGRGFDSRRLHFLPRNLPFTARRRR